jgi:DNA-binding MarR family transcriptional regulator
MPADDTIRSRTDCHAYKLRMAARRVSQVYDQELTDTGLTITQYAFLGHLRTRDGIAVGALADILILDATAVMRSLKPLEKQGLVAISVDQHDKRSRRVHITATGLTVHAAARPAWKRAQARISKVIGATDHAHFAGTIDRILDTLGD